MVLSSRPQNGSNLGQQPSLGVLCSGVDGLLTERGQGLLKGAPDPVFHTLDRVAEVLAAIEAVDLVPHELSHDSETQNLSAWNALAPAVGRMLSEVRRGTAALRALHPAPEDSSEPESLDLDMTFDFEREAPLAASRDRALDRAVDSQTAVPAAVHGLLSMLEDDIRRFGEKMRDPQFMADRWNLLGELHELKGNASHCLDAVVAAVVQPHVSVELHKVLSRYTTATQRALRLRSSIRDLWFEVEQLQQALARGHTDGPEAAATLRQVLDDWAERPSYGDLRPFDKRELIRIRQWAVHGAATEARTRLEDLVRFLEVMDGISQRERLAQHDREQVDLLFMLIESEVEGSELWDGLHGLYGRFLPLDRRIRQWRQSSQAPCPSVVRECLSAMGQDLGFEWSPG